MRKDWERGEEEFDCDSVEEDPKSEGLMDWFMEAGKELLSFETDPEEPVDAEELTADRKFEVYDDLYDKGFISQPEWEDKFHRYLSEKGREQFEEDLDSVGLSMDQLIDLSEDHQILKRRDGKAMEMKDELRDRLEDGRLDLASAQDLADEMLADGRISHDTHETVTRTIRLSQKEVK